MRRLCSNVPEGASSAEPARNSPDPAGNPRRRMPTANPAPLIGAARQRVNALAAMRLPPEPHPLAISAGHVEGGQSRHVDQLGVVGGEGDNLHRPVEPDEDRSDHGCAPELGQELGRDRG